MIRFGALAYNMGPLTKDSLFASRLKLLIIMAKAIDHQYPLGNRRRKAVIENAEFLFYETLCRSMALRIDMSGGSQAVLSDAPEPDRDKSYFDFLLLQRVQLLAVMTKSMAQGNPMGSFRRQAFAENLRYISGRFETSVELSKIPFLNVA